LQASELLQRLSVSSGVFKELTPEACADAYGALGLAYGELGGEHGLALLERSGSPEKIGRDFGRYSADRGLHFFQGHLHMDLQPTDSADLDKMKRLLELFHGMGIRRAVLHAFGDEALPEEAQIAQRSGYLRQLIHHIQTTDMVICLENLHNKSLLRTADSLLKLVEATDHSPHLGLCLDVGHLHRSYCHGLTQQTPSEYIQRAGSRLQALHMHDNMGKYDVHLLPFCQDGLDWKSFLQTLLTTEYDGLFNFEVHGVARGTPLPVRHMRLRHLQELAKYMLSREYLDI
jgi:sugar phosphate isomerase/epimerase